MTSMTLLNILFISLCTIFPYTQAQVQVAPQPPYVAQAFSFGWVGTANSTLTRCRTLNVTLTPQDLAHPPLGPFDLNVYSQFRAPLTINQGTTFWHLWTVNLDIGGPYLLSMNDAYGGTGGTSMAFNVIADPLGSTCGSSGMVSSALQLDVSAQRAQCGNVSVSVSGGTPPYTLTFVPELSLPKMVTYSTGNFNYTLDTKAGVNAIFSVEDALGSGATSSYFTVAASSDSSCLGVAPTLSEGAPALSTIYTGASATGAAASSSGGGKKSVIGPIVGGVVGGLLLICLGIIAGVFLYKKRRDEARAAGMREDGRQSEPLRRASLDAMSSARHTPQHDMMMNPHAAMITPYKPSISPDPRPLSYAPGGGSGWNSSENMRPMSGAPMMMMATGPNGEQMMPMNPDGFNPYPGGAQPYVMGPGGVPPHQQSIQQGGPQVQYFNAQGQPIVVGGRQSGEFGGSNTSGSGAGGASGGGGPLTHVSGGDEKRERRPSIPTPTMSPGAEPSPPYQPRE
ncbi:hypothetical protein FRB95_009784 [Tulasnella sp. JGI-2019a]|nr:hypothetical protein FRB95_009784 [Tulasnella sp. JGI-2019a]